ncbi:SDR family oxidoreductase [Novosphingobium sp.]|uniref:SDR family oxidoreductase n=1 Tax=Novosphingobium sp. TaxID=1874826 RepID=UPI002FDCE85A
MDLGIKGRKAIVCASSRGLGLACATALAREGAQVWINGRDAARLDDAAARIEEQTGARVTSVAADVGSAEGRAALLAACPDPDILVNNNHGPRPGHFDSLTQDDFLAALEGNMLAPLALIQAVIGTMRARKFGRIVNITSAQVRMPTANMGLSVSARAGLMAMAKVLQFDCVADNVTVNNLLPGPFDTDRLASLAEQMMADRGLTREQAYAGIGARGPAGRIGQPSEFGDACAYLCSAQAGFISGQNLTLDGGAYAGLF